MTGYTVNTGATTKFTEGWDRIFGGPASKAAKKVAKTSQAKAAPEASKAPAKVTKAPAKAAKKAAPKAQPAKTVKSKRASQAALTSGKR